MNFIKKIGLLFTLIPTVACASTQTTQPVTPSPITITQPSGVTQVNIVSVQDIGYDENNISRTLLYYTSNGILYVIMQSGKSCNYAAGVSSVKYDNTKLLIDPNASCSTSLKTAKKLETW